PAADRHRSTHRLMLQEPGYVPQLHAVLPFYIQATPPHDSEAARKISSLFAVLWAYNHTSYNRPAGFTQPGHPTVAPLWHLLSPEKNRRHQAGFPYGHSGKLLTQLTDARQPALPGN